MHKPCRLILSVLSAAAFLSHVASAARVVCEPEPGSDSPSSPYGYHTTNNGIQVNYNYWYEVTPQSGEVINSFKLFTGVQYDGNTHVFQNFVQPPGWDRTFTQNNKGWIISWTNTEGSALPDASATTFGFTHRNQGGWFGWQTDTDSATAHYGEDNGYGGLVHAPAAGRAGPSVVYVSPNGSHVLPYDTWETASTSIQSAVDAAADNASILVTNGRYRVESAITIRHKLTLRSVNGAGTTVVDGGYPMTTNPCFDVQHSGALVQGFSIINGGQGGAFLYASILRDCIITGNHALAYSGSGGGVSCYGALVEQCTIAGNESVDGGGVFLRWSGEVRDCRIENNMAGTGGGIASQDGRILNCILEGNTATNRGGGLYLNFGDTVRGCLIRNNSALNGGGVFVGYAASIDNCTLAGNTAFYGGGIYAGSNTSISAVQNSIIWSNSALEDADICNEWTNVAYVSCCASPLLPGTDNITDEPGFANFAAGNCRLEPESPCRDSGTNLAWMASAVDLDQNERVINGVVDMGAYEYGCSFRVDKTEGLPPLSVVFSAYASRSDAAVLTYKWDFDNDGSVDAQGAVVTAEYVKVGIYSPALTAADGGGDLDSFVRSNYIKVAPPVAYVSPAGTAVFPYTNWITAARDIQSAVDASSDGTVVLVTNGTYEITNQLNIIRGVTLQSLSGATDTVIQASLSSTTRCVYLSHPFASVEGFTIRRGQAPAGGGVHIATNGTVRHCTIEGNLGWSPTGPGGGGVFCERGGFVEDCVVTSNSSSYGGAGGIVLHYGGTVRNSTISSNSGGYANGGVSLFYGGLIQNSVISDNSSGYSVGGIDCLDGTVQNSLIARNVSDIGTGGIHISGTGIVQNCTIAENTGWGSYGGVGGVSCLGESLVRNSIICCNSNNTGTANHDVSGTEGHYDHCSTTPLVSGVGNITNDPLFVDAAASDFHLRQDSPCVDVGLNETWMNDATDLDGNVRIISDTVDMGPYEYQGALRCRFRQSATEGFSPLPVVFTASVSGTNTLGLWYSWDLDGDGDTDLEGADLQIVTSTYATVGRDFTVSLTVSNAAGEVFILTQNGCVRVGVREAYVSQEGANVFPYTNWSTAAREIQDAVNVGVGGTVIRVWNGAYVLTNETQITRGMTLESISGPTNTVLYGRYPASATRCLSLSHRDAIVDGFTITGGWAGDDLGGGGIRVNSGLLRDSIVRGNAASVCGGGVSLSTGGVIRNCLVVGNSVSNGGGGGVHCDRGGSVESCTISANKVLAGAGGGLSCSAGGWVRNTIISGNEAPADHEVVISGTGASFSYSCVTPSLPGIGNITNDPRFVNTVIGDYSLSVGSRCVDAGINQGWMIGTADLAGGDRIINSITDIGAYEAPIPTNVCVLSNDPEGTVAPPISTLRLRFSSVMNQDSFNLAEDIVSFVGPVGPIAVTGMSWLATDTLELQFSPQVVAGAYELILGPELYDRAGRAMDQDGDGVAGESMDDRYVGLFAVSGLYITEHQPSGDQTNPVARVIVTFSKPIVQSGFTLSDVSINGPSGSVAVTNGPTRVAETVYSIEFSPQTAAGNYHVYIGPSIQAADGCTMDQDGDGIEGESGDDRYDATFSIIDIIGPRTISHSPVRLNHSAECLDVTFNEPMDAASFTLDDAVMTGPAGAIGVDSISNLNERTFRLCFPAQSAAGTYRVTLGPDIRDLRGNLMNQDEDGLNGETFDDRYVAEFDIDLTGPRVVTCSVYGVQNVAVTSVVITFSERMATASLSNTLTLVGPCGTSYVSDVVSVGNGSYRSALPKCEADGDYLLNVASVATDEAGNALDQDGDGVAGESVDDRVEFDFVQVLPDLVVSSISVPAEMLPNQEVDLRWTVVNQGKGMGSGHWRDTVYLSKNAFLEPHNSNTYLGYLEYDQSLDSSGSYTRVLTATLPGVTSGRWWIVVVTDSEDELAETGGDANNAAISAGTIWIASRPYPDLQVSDISVPSTLSAGEPSSISWKVRNAGVAASSASYWYDRVYLSIYSNLDVKQATALQPNWRNPEPLAPGESYQQTVDINIPSWLAEQSYYVLVEADADDSVEEFDKEDNNVGISPYTTMVVSPPPAYLHIVNVQAPTQACAGDSITVTWDIENTGGTTADLSLFHSLNLSRDDQMSTPGGMGFAVPSWSGRLPPGGHGEMSGILPIPTNYWGDCYIIVWPEILSIGHNYGVVPFHITVPNPSDLQVTRVEAIAHAIAGQGINVGWTVVNGGLGGTPSVAWTDSVYLSRDREWDASDLFLGGHPHNGALGTGASYNVEGASYVVPADAEGEYYTVVMTDAGRQIYESSETNNAQASETPITVESINQDLIVLSAVAPVEGVAGRSIDVQWVVENAGADSTQGAGWLDAIYVSRNELLVASNSIPLGAFAHTTALPVGAAYTNSAAITLPLNIEGEWHVFFVCDSGNNVYERNGESNNTYRLTQPITITNPTPDLAVISASMPTNAIAGHSIAVDWCVTNIGAASALAPWTDAFYLSTDATWNVTSAILVATFTRTNEVAIGGSYGSAEERAEVILPDRLDGQYNVFFVADSEGNVHEKGLEGNNVYLLPQTIQIVDYAPDLEVQAATAPSNGVAGQLIPIQWIVVNHGLESSAGPWRDAVYLSEDTNFNAGEDGLFGEFQHTGSLLVDGTSAPPSQATWLRLPDRIAGEYHVFVIADDRDDIFEKDGETNNVYLIPQAITIANQAADLQVSRVSAPNEAMAGSVISVSWTVVNEGAERTEERYWQDGVYLSKDDVFDPASDIELGVISHEGVLEADGMYDQAHYFPLRQDIEGPYHVYVVTDLRHQVYEYDKETNNTTETSLSLEVVGLRIDLQVAAFSAPSSGIAGESVPVEWVIRNAGRDSTSVASWIDAMYLSTDDELDDGDTNLLVCAHNGALASAGEYRQSRKVAIPDDLVGRFYLIIKTDSGQFNDVFEYDAEDNNSKDTAIVFDLAPPPDLQVTMVSTPERAWSGQDLAVQWTVENKGSAVAAPRNGVWFDSVYLSRDPYLDLSSDIKLGSMEHNGELVAGGSYAHQMVARLPPGISGPFYVIILADSTDHVVERGFEDNNVGLSLSIVQIDLTPPADLQVVEIILPTNGVVYGEATNITFEVSNVGNYPAVGNWFDTLYVSSDLQLDADDFRIGRVSHTGDVGVGSSYIVDLVTNMPAVIPGDYHVIARADVFDDVRETIETNNILVSTGTISVVGRELVAGQVESNTLACGEARYYQLDAQQGDDLVLTLSGTAKGCSELYVAYGRMPTRSEYDLKGGINASSDLVARIAGALGGTYYVLVYQDDCQESPAPYELMVAPASFSIVGLSVSEGGSVGDLTVTITGYHLTPDMLVYLTDAAGDTVATGTLYFISSDRVIATFDLNGVPPGSYHLVTQNLDNGEVDSVAFQIAEGGAGSFWCRLLLPNVVRYGASWSAGEVQYGNSGRNDIISPMLTVAATGGRVGLTGDGSTQKEELRILALNPEGPVNVLPPGSSFSVPIYVTAENPILTVSLSVLGAGSDDGSQETIDWESYYSDAELAADMQGKLGSTWGEYVACLGNVARILAEEGNLMYEAGPLEFQSILLSYTSNEVNTSVMRMGQRYAGNPLPPPPDPLNPYNVHVCRWTGSEWNIADPLSEEDSFWIQGHRVVMLVHGWVSSLSADIFESIANQLLGKGYTVLGVNWDSFGFAAQTASRIPDVAQEAYRQLGDLGLSPENTHIIGHSHGAHIAGLISEHFGGRIDRVTALDASEEFSHIGSIGNFMGGGWGKDSAGFVEFYKSSAAYGAETAYGRDNFLLCPKGRTWGDYGGLDPDSHSYSLSWYLATIKNGGGIGFNWSIASWDALASKLPGWGVNDLKADVPWKGLIRGTDVVESVSIGTSGYNGANGERWNYSGPWAGSDKTSDSTAIATMIARMAHFVEMVPLNVAVRGDDGSIIAGRRIVVDYDVENRADNQSIRKDYREKAQFGGRVGILTQWQGLGPIRDRIWLSKDPVFDPMSAMVIGGSSHAAQHPPQKGCGFLDTVDTSENRKMASPVMALPGKGSICAQFGQSELQNPYYIFVQAGESYAGELYPSNNISDGIPISIGTAEIVADGGDPDQYFEANKYGYAVVTLSGSGSFCDPPGKIDRYRWVLNDQTYDSVSVTRTLQLGSYAATLSVESYGDPLLPEDNLSDSCGVTVHVVKKLPDKEPEEPDIPGKPVDSKQVNVIMPLDPNDKLVDAGMGDSRFVSEGERLTYAIRFENQSNATASAQLVAITDPLSTNLDWSTFELGDMQFGPRLVQVPTGLTYYNNRIDLRPDGNDLFVDVEARLDPQTGVATWSFTAVDPETGEFTRDPLDGFLPPNNANHDGEGFVKFRIRPRSGLPTGTVIPNIATIVFDWNEPIDTPLVYVTMDAGGPSSWVKLLPAESAPRFAVSWEGEDDAGGSGIASYDVYVSKDGLPYSCWLSETESLGAQFEGETNSTYAFYTVARDQVGRIEAAPSVPDASTKVIAVTSEEDTDNDGMPDSWEREHFGTILRGTAYSDSDGDGASDVEEYLADTDPTNRRSVFAVSRIVPVGTYYIDGIYTNYAGIFTNEWLGVYTNETDEIWTDRLLKVEGFVVEWSGATNKRYRLGRVTNLVGGYSDILGSNLPGVSPMNSYTDTVNDGSGPYFYRIQIDP